MQIVYEKDGLLDDSVPLLDPNSFQKFSIDEMPLSLSFALHNQMIAGKSLHIAVIESELSDLRALSPEEGFRKPELGIICVNSPTTEETERVSVTNITQLRS